jgi:hypothetical protein
MGNAYIRFDEGLKTVEIGTRNARGVPHAGVLLSRKAAVAAAVEVITNVTAGEATMALKRIIKAHWPQSVWARQLGL